MLINPYFPENIIFSYRHMFPKLTDATSVRVGNEWFPYETKQLLENSLPILHCVCQWRVRLGALRQKNGCADYLRSCWSALLFGLMLLPGAPLRGIFSAVRLDLCRLRVDASSRGPWPDPVLQRASSPRKWISITRVLLSAAVAVSIGRSIPRAREAMNRSKPYDLYQGASVWLEKNTSVGERIFQTDWDDFPRLFFYNTHNTYLIGLDPDLYATL